MALIDSDAYAAVKGNEHIKLQKRLREAESAFPVNMNARNGAGLTLLHVGRLSSLNPAETRKRPERPERDQRERNQRKTRARTGAGC